MTQRQRTKRRRSTLAVTGAPAKRASAPPRRSLPRLVLLLSTACLFVLVPLILCQAAGITLGQGSFYYRYSEIFAIRMQRSIPALLLGAAVAGVLFLLTRPEPGRQRAGVILGALVALLLGLWAWSAPPAAGRQHMFNFMSPSQDGAFVIEARTAAADGIVPYLRRFNARLKTSEEEMLGTRVLSNPPGVTIIARWTWQLWPGTWGNGWIDRWMLPADERVDVAGPWSIRVAFILHVMWVLSLVPCYRLARQYLPPAGAAAAALIMWFNPSTVLFTPGKDPAQLLTIALMLWAGLASVRTRSTPAGIALAFCSGMVLVLGTIIGLVHLWVALACAVALSWEAFRQKSSGDAAALKRLLLRQIVPAAAGAAFVLLLIDATTGWNVLSTLLAVQRRFAEIQPAIRLNHRLWLLIGLPIFLLFVSPSLYALVALNLRRLRHAPSRPNSGFGRIVLICTAAAMAITYLAGVPYELPRLWVAFLPLLVLGASIDLPLMRARRGAHRAWKVLALLAVVNVTFTALHWTRFDVRESEYRMITRRLWR